MDTLLSQLSQKLEQLLLTEKLLAVKAEFEAEGTRIDELSALSELCCKYNIPLTLKIGGPLAQRDIYEAFQLGASNILVPMVESSYAVSTSFEFYKKFSPLFKELQRTPNLLINIESDLAINNLKSIIELINKNQLPIKTLVLGRSDLSKSLGITNVDSSEIFNLTNKVLNDIKPYSIDLTLGGNMTSKSFRFVSDLSEIGLHAFESRKCTFKLTNKISNIQFNNLINMGLEFELAWLNYKKAIYSNRSDEENNRIEIINSRIN